MRNLRLRSMSTEAMATKAPDTAHPPLYKVVMEVQFKRVAISDDSVEEEGWDLVDIDPVSASKDQKNDNNEKASTTTIPIPDRLGMYRTTRTTSLLERTTDKRPKLPNSAVTSSTYFLRI